MNSDELLSYKKIVKENKIVLIVSILLMLASAFFTSKDIYSILGIGLAAYVTLRFIVMLGYSIPVIELMLFIASTQWIVGPLLDYSTSTAHHKMHMYVSEEEYMRITIPLFFCFTAASLLISRIRIVNTDQIKEVVNKYKYLPFYIIGVGIIFRFINPFMPVSFNFIAYLIINFSIVGLGLCLVSNYSWTVKIITGGITFIPQVYYSISTGMFHNLIIWIIFSFIFLNLSIKFSFTKKVGIMILGILFLSVIQLIKRDFRERITSSSGNKIEIFIDMLFDTENTEELQNEETINDVNIRVNQGWIISKIYDRIPSKKDYLEGETISNAFEALIPRVLYPDKKATGGGKYTFELLTGIILSEGTAMGASLLGEFYGNYGVTMGAVSFIIWGLFLQVILIFIYRFQRISPIIYFCLPIIFFQVIKAETDLSTVLNHIVKSLLFILFSILFVRSFFKIRI